MSTTSQRVDLNIEKGVKVDITKGQTGLNRVSFGMGWDANQGSGDDFDLDAVAICLEKNGKIAHGNPESILFFNSPSTQNPNNPKEKAIYNKALVYSGDERTGATAGDDETIVVDLAKIPQDIDSVLFCCNIYKASERRQNFGQVKKAYIRVYNAETNQDITRYDLSEDFSGATGAILGKLYRKDAEWKFQAVGDVLNGTIQDIVNKYQ